MTRAEKLALEEYPRLTIEYRATGRDYNGYRRQGFINGYEAAEKYILAIIQSRLSEIIGDAQPKPILRTELQELIKRIKDEN